MDFIRENKNIVISIFIILFIIGFAYKYFTEDQNGDNQALEEEVITDENIDKKTINIIKTLGELKKIVKNDGPNIKFFTENLESGNSHLISFQHLGVSKKNEDLLKLLTLQVSNTDLEKVGRENPFFEGNDTSVVFDLQNNNVEDNVDDGYVRGDIGGDENAKNVDNAEDNQNNINDN